MIKRLSHATLLVLDQKKAFDVYVNKLGFKVTNDMVMEGGMRWLTVSPPGQPEVEILLAEPNPPMFDAEMGQHVRVLLEHNAMGGGVWEADDCEKTYKELKGKGIEFIKTPTKEFYGVEALFRDGCGNWFSLTEHPKQ